MDLSLTFLGVDAQLYSVRQPELVRDKDGLPVRWDVPALPSVKLIAQVPVGNPMRIEEHPLRKAYFKWLAAKTHQIFEKQRPQDVTIEEARNMVWEWLHEYGKQFDLAGIISEYWTF